MLSYRMDYFYESFFFFLPPSFQIIIVGFIAQWGNTSIKELAFSISFFLQWTERINMILFKIPRWLHYSLAWIHYSSVSWLLWLKVAALCCSVLGWSAHVPAPPMLADPEHWGKKSSRSLLDIKFSEHFFLPKPWINEFLVSFLSSVGQPLFFYFFF